MTRTELEVLIKQIVDGERALEILTDLLNGQGRHEKVSRSPLKTPDAPKAPPCNDAGSLGRSRKKDFDCSIKQRVYEIMSASPTSSWGVDDFVPLMQGIRRCAIQSSLSNLSSDGYIIRIKRNLYGNVTP